MQTAVAEENHLFSPTALNSLRFGMNRAAVDNAESVKALIPEAADTSRSIPWPYRRKRHGSRIGVFQRRARGAGAYLFHYTSLQVYDDLFLTRGLHFVKFGFALERMRHNILALSVPNGQFVFGSLQNFLTNRPDVRRCTGAAQSLTPRGLRETLAGGYIQDDWRARPTLTVNLGFRYEATTVPTEVNGKLSVLRDIDDANPISAIRCLPIQL